MKKINTFFIVATFFNSLCLQGMSPEKKIRTHPRHRYNKIESNRHQLVALDTFVGNFDRSGDPKRYIHYSSDPVLQYNADYSTIAAQNTIFNITSNPLVTLPDGMLLRILPLCRDLNKTDHKTLKKHCKSLFALHSTCKRFNSLLTFKEMGNACKDYAAITTLNQMNSEIYDMNYRTMRLIAMILINTNIDTNTENVNPAHKRLLDQAIRHNDIKFTKTLLAHGANPNKEYIANPIFFNVKTIEVAQLLIDNGLDVHASNTLNPNVLWHITSYDEYPSALLTFYLTHKVDAKKIKASGSCLFHRICYNYSINPIDFDNFSEKIIILLNTIPEMINTKNNKGKTPLDYAQTQLSFTKKYFPSYISSAKKIIAMLKKYGFKTAQKLKEENEQKITHRDCIICFEKNENMMIIPCESIHTEGMCLACYNQWTQHNNTCPLCRSLMVD
jgi:hypothetical protein